MRACMSPWLYLYTINKHQRESVPPHHARTGPHVGGLVLYRAPARKKGLGKKLRLPCPLSSTGAQKSSYGCSQSGRKHKKHPKQKISFSHARRPCTAVNCFLGGLPFGSCTKCMRFRPAVARNWCEAPSIFAFNVRSVIHKCKIGS